MSSRTRKTLTKVADILERFARGLVTAVELVVTDAVYGKAKYRRRTRQPRPIVQKTVIVRPSAPRIVRIREK